MAVLRRLGFEGLHSGAHIIGTISVGNCTVTQVRRNLTHFCLYVSTRLNYIEDALTFYSNIEGEACFIWTSTDSIIL